MHRTHIVLSRAIHCIALHGGVYRPLIEILSVYIGFRDITKNDGESNGEGNGKLDGNCTCYLGSNTKP